MEVEMMMAGHMALSRTHWLFHRTKTNYTVYPNTVVMSIVRVLKHSHTNTHFIISALLLLLARETYARTIHFVLFLW